MTKKKMISYAAAVSVWVSVYCFIQFMVSRYLGMHLEFWPALIAPVSIKLLGEGKENTIRYYKLTITGMAAGLLFLMSEVYLVPMYGVLGLLIPLSIIIFAIAILGAKLPSWFGGLSLIVLNFVIMDSTHIFTRALTNLAILLIGATIFLFVEHLLHKLIIGHVPEMAAEIKN
jgi:hypothetical protein